MSTLQLLPDETPPPSDFDAEQAVLGAILMEGQEAAARAFAIVTPSDFYRTYHRQIAEACYAVYQRREPVDCLTVSAELRRRGLLEEVGSGEYLTALLGEVPTAAHLPRYANIVAEKAVLRHLDGLSHEIASGARQGPEDVGRYLAEAAERLQDLYRQRVSRGTLLSPATRFEADITSLEADLQAPAGEVSSARTGISKVDSNTGGLEAERLVVVKADTKHGKSQLARQTALTTAQRFVADGSGRVVLVFVLEEGERAWVRKAWAWLGVIDSMPLLKRGLWRRYLERQPDADKRLNAAQCEWGTLAETLRYTDRCRDIAQIEATCRALAYEQPVGMVVIDYFQLMTGGDPKLTTEEQKLTDRGNRLQMLADELACPVLCPAQLSHDSANKRTYTKGARGIEHNCSLVLEWRRGMGEAGEMEDWGKLACLLARNGPGFAPVTIRTDRTCGRFWDELEYAQLVAAESAAGVFHDNE